MSRGARRDLDVRGCALVVELPELLAVSSERAPRAGHPRPGGVDIDLHPGDKRAAEAVLRSLGQNCAAAERNHCHRPCKRLRDDLLLDPAELGLAALEELADRAEALLDLLVGVDKGPMRESCDLAA